MSSCTKICSVQNICNQYQICIFLPCIIKCSKKSVIYAEIFQCEFVLWRKKENYFCKNNISNWRTDNQINANLTICKFAKNNHVLYFRKCAQYHVSNDDRIKTQKKKYFVCFQFNEYFQSIQNDFFHRIIKQLWWKKLESYFCSTDFCWKSRVFFQWKIVSSQFFPGSLADRTFPRDSLLAPS